MSKASEDSFKEVLSGFWEFIIVILHLKKIPLEYNFDPRVTVVVLFRFMVVIPTVILSIVAFIWTIIL